MLFSLALTVESFYLMTQTFLQETLILNVTVGTNSFQNTCLVFATCYDLIAYPVIHLSVTVQNVQRCRRNSKLSCEPIVVAVAYLVCGNAEEQPCMQKQRRGICRQNRWISWGYSDHFHYLQLGMELGGHWIRKAKGKGFGRKQRASGGKKAALW